MAPDRIEIRFWPLRVMVKGERAIAALRVPLAVAAVTVAIILGVASPADFEDRFAYQMLWNAPATGGAPSRTHRSPPTVHEPTSARCLLEPSPRPEHYSRQSVTVLALNTVALAAEAMNAANGKYDGRSSGGQGTARPIAHRNR